MAPSFGIRLNEDGAHPLLLLLQQEGAFQIGPFLQESIGMIMRMQNVGAAARPNSMRVCSKVLTQATFTIEVVNSAAKKTAELKIPAELPMLSRIKIGRPSGGRCPYTVLWIHPGWKNHRHTVTESGQTPKPNYFGAKPRSRGKKKKK